MMSDYQHGYQRFRQQRHNHSGSFNDRLNQIYQCSPEIGYLAEERAYAENLSAFGLLPTHRARVVLILDISKSMQNPNHFFAPKNKVQELVNNILALAGFWDNDGKVEIIPFGTDSNSVYTVKIGKHHGIVDHIVQSEKGLQNETNYAAALRTLREKILGNSQSLSKIQSAAEPTFAIFLTDGVPNSAVPEHELLDEFRSLSHQACFLKIIALRGRQAPNFHLLQHLVDDGPVKGDRHSMPDYQKRACDNSDYVEIHDPQDITIKDLLREYPAWLMEAHRKGILEKAPGVEPSRVKSDKRMRGQAPQNHFRLW